MPSPRPDIPVVADLIPANSRVLDVGCGAGELLLHLQARRNTLGHGLEIDPQRVKSCLNHGLAVVQGDADEELDSYPDRAFDFAVLNFTLPSLKNPQAALLHLVRIARFAVVSIHNHAHWRRRLRFLTLGSLPFHKPYSWFDSPDAHPCSLNEFRRFCSQNRLNVHKRIPLTARGKRAFIPHLAPNLLAPMAVHLLSAQERPSNNPTLS